MRLTSFSNTKPIPLKKLITSLTQALSSPPIKSVPADPLSALLSPPIFEAEGPNNLITLSSNKLEKAIASPLTTSKGLSEDFKNKVERFRREESWARRRMLEDFRSVRREVWFFEEEVKEEIGLAPSEALWVWFTF